MSDQKISALLALSLISSPIALPASALSFSNQTKTVSTAISPEATSQRSAARKMRHQLAPMPLLQPMGTYVGELQEKWQFPSDHLPIGMTFDDLNLVSWNVLDAEYMSWVTEKNSQGLSRSMIVDEHVYIGDSKLTIRDKHVVDLILQTISHPTHPRSILSLQECSKPFIEELRSRLPAYFEVISNHGDAVLLDRRRFEVVEAKEVSGIFADAPYRTLQDITLRRLDNGQLLRLVNVHLPGDPTKPGRFEFAQYLANTFDPALTMLAMGDMNFDELGMSEAMTQAFRNNSPFSLYSPYCTDISPYVFKSKAIDHFLVYSPNPSSVVLSTPDQIMPGLAPMVELLQGSNRVVPFVVAKPTDVIAEFAQKNCLNEGTLQPLRAGFPASGSICEKTKTSWIKFRKFFRIPLGVHGSHNHFIRFIPTGLQLRRSLFQEGSANRHRSLLVSDRLRRSTVLRQWLYRRSPLGNRRLQRSGI
jgi:endonuclease/exonuclease/phosphatase family metal-dependent hydrolase